MHLRANTPPVGRIIVDRLRKLATERCSMNIVIELLHFLFVGGVS